MWGVTADQLRLALSCQRRQNEPQAVQPQLGQRRAWTKVSSPHGTQGQGHSGTRIPEALQRKGPLSRKIWCCSPLSSTPSPRSRGSFKPHVLSPFGLT